MAKGCSARLIVALIISGLTVALRPMKVVHLEPKVTRQ
ncbi:unnamed protein product [Acanthoscelides obtectus]|uniref:Uncharacterized protein n=1 Tax=Acanthoscelides obtectus TaxID=200917 RepID=A0A9P0JJS9_ACAOB|nr:unnamed protein product [Acanthoscelides obtectus]CAK1639641.1 hypothetical protein AOBTE_LOCUS11289 [Acanthoscelides obtectus]